MDAMEKRFNEKLINIMQNKKQNNGFLPRKKYCRIIDKVRESKLKTSGKKPGDYQLLKRYDVVKVGNTERLISLTTLPAGGDDNNAASVRYYVQLEEIFRIIHETHLATGHGGRTRILRELQKSYKNITCEQIMIYLSLCENCPRKSSAPRRETVLRPLMMKEAKSRCQVQVMDMQSQPDYEFKFVLIYHDHQTKFIQLRPLKTREAQEVANALLDIFTIFGAPSIIECGNGRDFCNRIVEEICSMWNELKIVSGRETTGTCNINVVEEEIEKSLNHWLETNQTSRWVDGLRFVQFARNRTFHEEINCTPHEALFGCSAEVGLKSSSLPKKIVEAIQTEEELERLIETPADGKIEAMNENGSKE